MKLLIAVCIFALVGLSLAEEHSRGCRYIMGRCVEECPVGTRAYAPGCAEITPEATCKQPNPVAARGIVCDFSTCYCEAPTVRDEISGQCVPLEQCPKDE